MRRRFFIRPLWDAEAGVFISESDIEGLHIEAETEAEFFTFAAEIAPELIVDNHMGDLGLGAHTTEASLRDSLAAILPVLTLEPARPLKAAAG